MGSRYLFISFFILFGGRVLFHLSVECVSVLQLFPFGLITEKWICKNKIGHRCMYDKLDITSSIPRGSDYVDNHYELKYMTPPKKDLIHRFFIFFSSIFLCIIKHSLFKEELFAKQYLRPCPVNKQ